MQQLELFGGQGFGQPRAPHRGHLDAASEDLLHAYHRLRLAESASSAATATEVSQLRSLVHASVLLDGPDTMASLLNAPTQLAHVLVTPPVPISVSSARVRLLAVQNLMRLLGSSLGWDVEEFTARLDGALPRRPARGWFATGLLVGGDSQQRRASMPTLFPKELEQLVAATGAGKPPSTARRDTAILALLCFSGLRMCELAALTWDDAIATILPSGGVGLAICLSRRDTSVQLSLPWPAVEALRAWEADRRAAGRRSGVVFSTLADPSRPLDYRTLRRIVQAACCAAGLPALAASDLRAACAYWLHGSGFTPHEIAALLGVAHVRTVDALLRRHLALDAQRRTRSAVTP